MLDSCVNERITLLFICKIFLFVIVKDKAVQSVLRVLVAIKANEIDGSIKGLDQTKLDLLMKYIYRGFEQCSDGNGYGAQLLLWHDKVLKIVIL